MYKKFKIINKEKKKTWAIKEITGGWSIRENNVNVWKGGGLKLIIKDRWSSQR